MQPSLQPRPKNTDPLQGHPRYQKVLFAELAVCIETTDLCMSYGTCMPESCQSRKIMTLKPLAADKGLEQGDIWICTARL